MKNEYVSLAEYSVGEFVKTGRMALLPNDISEELTGNRAGVFVCIKKHGQLRGCIGTISPVAESVAAEIMRNAVSACSEDPRFPAVTEDELAELVISVDVLFPPEPISSLDMLDVKKYGVIVSHGRRRGLLLPNLDGVDTVEEQVGIAMQKAGIQPHEEIELERFEVLRYE